MARSKIAVAIRLDKLARSINIGTSEKAGAILTKAVAISGMVQSIGWRHRQACPV